MEIEWIRDMLYHSFVLKMVENTVRDTWLHIEELIEEYRQEGEQRFGIPPLLLHFLSSTFLLACPVMKSPLLHRPLCWPVLHPSPSGRSLQHFRCQVQAVTTPFRLRIVQ